MAHTLYGVSTIRTQALVGSDLKQVENATKGEAKRFRYAVHVDGAKYWKSWGKNASDPENAERNSRYTTMYSETGCLYPNKRHRGAFLFNGAQKSTRSRVAGFVSRANFAELLNQGKGIVDRHIRANNTEKARASSSQSAQDQHRYLTKQLFSLTLRSKHWTNS